MEELVVKKKIKTNYDYLDKLSKLYPSLKKEQIRMILMTMQKNILSLVKNYGGIFLSSRDESNKYTIMINGLNVFSIKDKQKYWTRKMKTKIRVRYRRSKPIWNGYYYFALHDEELAKILAHKTNTKKKIVFERLKLYKIFEECILMNPTRQHVFKTPFLLDCGYTLFKENYILEKFEYIYRKSKDGLEPINKKENYHNKLHMRKDQRNYAWLKLMEIQK